MVIRPEEKERGVCKWMQTVCVCVWSTCLCLSCLWQVSEGSAPLRIRVCMCEYVWWLLMCVCVCMCVHAPMCTQVYMCGRNERQESHLLWCNDCAIWRQERFWCGSSWYLARWPFSIPPLTIWQMCQLDYFKRPWINKRLGESAACSPKESRGRRLHAHTHTHSDVHTGDSRRIQKSICYLKTLSFNTHNTKEAHALWKAQSSSPFSDTVFNRRGERTVHCAASLIC